MYELYRRCWEEYCSYWLFSTTDEKINASKCNLDILCLSEKYILNALDEANIVLWFTTI